MRVSSKTLQLQWLADIYRRQADLARVQKQVTSGLRIATAKDDPAGAGQAVLLRQGLDRLANYAANAEAARRRLALEENALDNIGNAFGRVRELAVQAGGGIQTAETRAAIANELAEILANIVDIANSQDGEGRFLFSGNASGEPIAIVNGVAQYHGDDGVRLQRIGESRTVREGDAGSEVFFAIRNGNGRYFVEPGAANQGTGFFTSATLTDGAAWIPDDYTITFTSASDWTVTDSSATTIASGTWAPGEAITFAGATVVFAGQPAAGDTFAVRPSINQSVFDTLGRLIAGLEDDGNGPQARAAFQNMLNSALLDLDQAERHLSSVRSSIGARLAAVDEQKSNDEELALQLESTLSTLTNVDYPQAVSRLQSELIGLEAAHQVFAHTRTLSLFDVL